ncbi:SARP family transcriptional regulator [Catellatospora methionotrophica]|uniref:SARP family transcriptional regulator n=1 Tax=Catellatospora methionotrophica TaxID=121620 RepID=A0A8J3PEN1_9ACTN|nr:BTAD domain-containing putative transcriptional regulator [Catellatospora methionotrophica]GIG13849.1 SARP family transcriptional regulator [Catellatospora methionotrophica]
MEFRLLGPVSAYAGDEAVPLGGAKPKALLAALLLEHGRVVSAHRLVDVLWGEDPPDTARALVQTYVSTLRRTFARYGAGDLITTAAPGYVIRIEPEALDVEQFTWLLTQGRAAAAAGDSPAAADLLRAADALWQGPALSGLDATELTAQASRLDELRATAVEERIAAEIAAGQWGDLVAELTVLVGQRPTNERLRGQLMTVLYRLGRQAEALACYREGRDVLIGELGVEPGPELTALHHAILRGGTEQLAAASPELTGPGAVHPVPAQLPPVPADFTGRAAEIEALAQGLLPTDGAPAVQVIAGPGGTGKSTLATAVAHRLAEHFPDGQLYAELRGMSDAPAEPGEVLSRFLRALGVEQAQLPESIEERADLYRSLLAQRRMLLVLDDAASEQQVRPLLPGRAGNAVVITSRDRLSGLSGTTLTDLRVLEPDEALLLLRRLAGDGRVDEDVDAARRIVEYCGNLPLALRIVSARLAGRRALPLKPLADRLADESRRLNHLSAGDVGVRSSIELSYRALDDGCRTTLRRLGWFGVPDFSPWVVSWLAETSPTEAEELVEQLVDAQLVEFVGVDRMGGLRYRLHDLIRLYARECAALEEPAEDLADAVARALRGWLALIHRAAVDSPPAEIRWRRPFSPHDVAEELTALVIADPWDWFEAEQSALASGVERALVLGLYDLVFEFASARNASAFMGANRFAARTRVIEAALTAARRAAKPHDEAVILTELGQLRYDQDHYTEARRQFRAALSLFRELNDLPGQATALAGLGIACREPGRFAEGVHFLDQATALLHDARDDIGIGYCRRIAGSVRLELGDYDGALADLTESLAAYRRAGSRLGEGHTLRTLGLYHRARDEWDDAERRCAESAEIFHELGDELMEAYAVRALAKARMRQGHHGEALPRLEWALSVSHTMGDRWGQGATLRVLGQLHLAEHRLDLAQACFDAAHDIWQSMDVPVWQARLDLDRSRLLAARGDTAGARTAQARARQVFHDHGARELAELDARG